MFFFADVVDYSVRRNPVDPGLKCAPSTRLKFIQMQEDLFEGHRNYIFGLYPISETTKNIGINFWKIPLVEQRKGCVVSLGSLGKSIFLSCQAHVTNVYFHRYNGE